MPFQVGLFPWGRESPHSGPSSQSQQCTRPSTLEFWDDLWEQNFPTMSEKKASIMRSSGVDVPRGFQRHSKSNRKLQQYLRRHGAIRAADDDSLLAFQMSDHSTVPALYCHLPKTNPFPTGGAVFRPDHLKGQKKMHVHKNDGCIRPLVFPRTVLWNWATRGAAVYLCPNGTEPSHGSCEGLNHHVSHEYTYVPQKFPNTL